MSEQQTDGGRYLQTPKGDQPPKGDQRTFVIVHGGWGGGWEWTPVARLLREQGHEVFTPTLTGLGERSHLGPEVDLSTHVQDVIGVLEWEDLRDVVLCGASYSGMVITGVADRVPERLGLAVYVDAFVPSDGESTLDFMPADFEAAVGAATDERGHGWFPIPEQLLPPTGLIAEQTRQHYVDRLTSQPAASCAEAVRLEGGLDRVPKAFVRCTGDDLDPEVDPMATMAARAREQGWLYRELDLPHDAHLFDPARTATVLSGLASVALQAA